MVSCYLPIAFHGLGWKDFLNLSFFYACELAMMVPMLGNGDGCGEYFVELFASLSK